MPPRCVRGGVVYGGQYCIGVQRILVHQSRYAAFLEKVLRRIEETKVGDPLTEGVDVGPVIDEKSARRIEQWVQEAIEQGAKLEAGGQRAGAVLQPTVLSATRPGMKVEDEEIFGPVVTINPYGDIAATGVVAAKPKVLTATQFTDETVGDLAPYDCVFLCDVPSLSASEARRLERHVRRGGGVIFCMGNQVQAGEYNRVLYRNGAGLLPASLIGVQQAAPAWNFQLALEADSERTAPIAERICDSALMTASSLLDTSACASMMSIGASVPTSTFRWLFLSSSLARSSDCRATSRPAIEPTRL